MRRRLSSVIIVGALVCVATLVGLTPAAATQDTTAKVLRFRWYFEWIEDLEPQTNEHGIADLARLNYEALTRLDGELNVVPGAAESWEFSQDGLKITFHLRENLTYSDGSPLTAERFRYAIARRCDPHMTSRGAQSLFDIVGCEELHNSLGEGSGTPHADLSDYEAAKANLGVRALDDRTLEIRLRQPAPYFPALTHWVEFIPVKQELIEAGGPEWWRDPATWVGNGPFQVAEIAEDANPPHISLVRNERYWGGKAKLDSIELVIMPDELTLDAYKRGELDIIYADFALIPEFEADPVLSRELVATPILATDIFNFNLMREPFQDRNVREAFSYAFDRDRYCKTIDYTCRPVLSWIPPQIPGAIETDAYAFDPAKAREALAASTYGGPQNLPEVVWEYPADDPWSQRRAEWLADQFRQVLDVELTLQEVPEDALDLTYMREHPEEAATRPQIMDTWWWVSLPDPHYWMKFWTCGDERFAAIVGYCNPAYDALAERADRELDPVERIRLAEESQRMLIADAPAVFGYTFDNIYLVKPYVTGYSTIIPNQSFPGQGTPLTVDIVQPA